MAPECHIVIGRIMTEETVTLTQFTDPLCPWSWNAEPVVRGVCECYREQLTIDIIMGGLTGSSADSVCPLDIASHWQTAAENDCMPIDTGKWRETSPYSSYPASVAYKAAELQDEALANTYLRRLREAVATEQRDIEQQAVLVQIATEVGFDGDRFRRDLTSERPRSRFQGDLDRTQENGVTAFPTYQLAGPAGSTWIVGNQPAERFVQAIDTIAPDRQPLAPRPLGEFITYHNRVATREVASVYDITVPKANQALKSLVDEERARAIERSTGTFWEPFTARPVEENSLH